MPDPKPFAAAIAAGYRAEGRVLELGRGVHDGALHREAVVQIPLAMVNRHGLIAGATGTGKTKTAQGLAERLSAAGVPVLIADVKGDVSGLAAPGSADPEGGAARRAADLGIPYEPAAFPVEYLALGGIGPGVPLRATVSDFGPQLLAKVLGSNETQEQSLQLVFRYADQKGLPLLDLSDLRALLTYLDAHKEELRGIGGLSQATVGVLLRAMVGLEDGGGTEFFGEPEFDVADLLRVAADGRGVISCVELAAVQEFPALWSTALMWLVAELFETLPEAGDLPKPKLVVFLDEAHLLFKDATPAFVAAIEQTVRLIRSKGVGVFFITQTPRDVPSSVLAQLGNRVQHALRAFTPEDEQALRATVKTYPRSPYYDIQELLTSLGIGEAAVTILSETGVPTPVVHTRMLPPASRMAPADDVAGAAAASPLNARYGTRVDAESARELLEARLAGAAEETVAPPAPRRPDRVPAPDWSRPGPSRPGPAGGGGLDSISDFLQSREGKALQRKVTRGVLGALRRRI